jgi:hypothetical protein
MYADNRLGKYEKSTNLNSGKEAILNSYEEEEGGVDGARSNDNEIWLGNEHVSCSTEKTCAR